MRQTVCDQCEKVVKPGFRVKLEALFRVMHANHQGHTQERRRLDFCGRFCLAKYVDEHEEIAGP